MVVSLFSGLYFLARDGNDSKRTLHALTARISIWVVLFALLGFGIYSGMLTPSNSLTPKWAQPPPSAAEKN
jgi:hypothetical protein